MDNKPKLYIKIKAKQAVELTHREAQLITRLRQLRNAGKTRAEVELAAEDGPKVREG